MAKEKIMKNVETFVSKMNVGNTIKNYRVRKNMTQEELASAIGVSRGRVSHWEIGTNFPSVDAARKLSKRLRVRIGILTGEIQNH